MTAPQHLAKTEAAGRADAQHYAAQQVRFQPDAQALRAELQRQRAIGADFSDGWTAAGPEYWQGFRNEMSEILDAMTPHMGADPETSRARDYLRAEGWRMGPDGLERDQ